MGEVCPCCARRLAEPTPGLPEDTRAVYVAKILAECTQSSPSGQSEKGAPSTDGRNS